MSDLQREDTRASDILSAAAAEEEEKPIRCAKFRQQELWAWKPVWSPMVVVIMYLVVSIIFIPVGVIVYSQSTRLVNTPRFRYDNQGMCDIGPGEGAFGDTPPEKNCSFMVEITRDVVAPSFMYYGLVNFYQNARTYVKSRDFGQLRGDEATVDSAGGCEPLITDANGSLRVPCGLVANSLFNDSFFFCRDRDCNEPFNLSSKGIAWDVDVNTRFRASDKNTAEENELITSEDFMVWMRVAGYRNWKKLYRRIEEDIPAGNYTVIATSRFPVESFGGEKFFFISETTWFGGPNEVLGLSYITVGAVALILAIMFVIKSRQMPDLELPPVTSVRLVGISPDVRVSEDFEQHDSRDI